jgi:transposase
MKHKIIKQNVGVDIAKDDFKVVFSIIGEQLNKKILASRTFRNDLPGCKDFLQWIHSKKDNRLPVHVTVEATGVYHEQLCYYLCRQTDVKVHVVLPNLSKKYGQRCPNKSSIGRVKKHIQLLDKQILQIETDIKSFIAGEEELKKKLSYLTSVPGVGLITAVTIVYETLSKNI